jgi:hypothetical protein
MAERYNIFHKEDLLFSNLSEDEYFEKMGNLADEFYQRGLPHPDDLRTEIFVKQGDA